MINSIEDSVIGEANSGEKAHVLTPTDKVRIALIQKGLKMRDLATITGLKIQYLRQVVRGSFAIWPARRKIEAALGEKFWTEES